MKEIYHNIKSRIILFFLFGFLAITALLAPKTSMVWAKQAVDTYKKHMRYLNELKNRRN